MFPGLDDAIRGALCYSNVNQYVMCVFSFLIFATMLFKYVAYPYGFSSYWYFRAYRSENLKTHVLFSGKPLAYQGVLIPAQVFLCPKYLSSLEFALVTYILW